MFGIGPLEMGVVAVVALMLFSPRELPKMLRTVAKFWGQLRATADEFKDTIMHADGVDELQELVKGTKGQIRQVEQSARQEMMKARAEMRKAQAKLMKATRAKEEVRKRDAGEAAESKADDPEQKGDGTGGFPTPVAAGAPVARSAKDGDHDGEHPGDRPASSASDPPADHVPSSDPDAAVPVTAFKTPLAPPPVVSPPPLVRAPPPVNSPPAVKPAPKPAASSSAPAHASGRDADPDHNQGAA